VIPVSPPNPNAFVSQVRPLLEAKDLKGLIRLVKSNYSLDQLLQLLTCPCNDASKVAALTLAWTGCGECVPKLAERLKDSDPMINQMVEHALWAIWFRLGTSDANVLVCRGTQAINRQEYQEAIEHFNAALGHCPTFAEAYNQRAIAYYLLEQYEESIADCRQAVEYMPCHFGAWAGMGHCHAHMGRLKEAVASYRKALEINPHLDQIRQSIEELKSC
jgi:tetratricopeptide (TPR) repeat protein